MSLGQRSLSTRMKFWIWACFPFPHKSFLSWYLRYQDHYSPLNFSTVPSQISIKVTTSTLLLQPSTPERISEYTYLWWYLGIKKSLQGQAFLSTQSLILHQYTKPSWSNMAYCWATQQDTARLDNLRANEAHEFLMKILLGVDGTKDAPARVRDIWRKSKARSNCSKGLINPIERRIGQGSDGAAAYSLSPKLWTRATRRRTWQGQMCLSHLTHHPKHGG